VAFSAYQHRLAIWLTGEEGDRVEVIDIQTGEKLASPRLAHMVSFAYHGIEDKVFCATTTGDLKSFNVGAL
jgi:hypothetical protein